MEDAKRGTENALRANPQDLRDQYEKQLKDLHEAYPRGDVGTAYPKKMAVPGGRGPEMIETIRQGLKDEGFAVSISQLCCRFGVPRRAVYYRPTKKPPTVQERFAAPIKQMIEERPLFGYLKLTYVLKLNKNTVQRVFQLM